MSYLILKCILFTEKTSSKIKQYNEFILKRKNSEEQNDSAVKQMKIKDYSVSCRQVTQSTIDRLVIEFVCESLQPFTVVELPTFKKFIQNSRNSTFKNQAVQLCPDQL